MDTGAWQATVRGVIKSQTQLQHLSNNTGMYVYVPVCGVHVRVCVCVRERERETEGASFLRAHTQRHHLPFLQLSEVTFS